ncbi:galactokinase [Renibacterium salmoninarum ATCC 33209]|uniref:Galactokinase n=1 Tax=Renibacterium salmoninarum (strain ATCC 33209 / DSM 20767 / JCM 11484 / NBRC 15589 / NCIMB 2235) TaxID=288705 RepID=A9WUA6_RENSM|nr:galactokinase [Renibacterium salmoninarum]ABY24777.1 galactokinase [Renibacterium salmoninarum ATCC 33209]
MTIQEAFSTEFGYAPDGLWQAPGRVNLIGEHTDYNHGFVLPFAIDRQATVAVRLRQDSIINLISSSPGTEPVTSTVENAGQATGWTAYLLGVVWSLQEQGIRVPGFDVYLDSTVPTGAGLSSSAALECAIALALNELLEAGLSREELVLIGQRAENSVVGAPTGILDQSASLLAQEGQAVFLDCQSRESGLVPLDLATTGLTLLVMDTKVSHAHADGGYADRRKSCERAAAELGLSSLRELTVAGLDRAATVLDEETFRRARHIVTENQRVLETVELLRAGLPEQIGPILDQSHLSMRDDFEISSLELDLAVATAMANGAIGARMTGGGFGGSAIDLVPLQEADRVRAAVNAEFAAADFGQPNTFDVVPGPGARRL